MDKLQRKFPSYKGNDPYIYFAFSEADQKKAGKILRILLERGCRVWYCCGPSGSSDELLRRQERAGGADLTVLYLTASACADSDLKNFVLVNQSAGRSILCLDPDGEDRRLMMGLYENVPHVLLYDVHGDEDIENAVIHAEGFSQEMIGEPVRTSGSFAGKLSLLLCVLAVILAAISFAGYKYFARSPGEIHDEVVISDQVLRSALRKAANGGVITEELLSQITYLELDGMPESWDDISLLPSLDRISVPQNALLEGGALPDGNYTIELNGSVS
ncbi:MAG: hypothetical protein K5771_09370 [Oscillospiraceae bacterium]|nr:hypothetical protein [Oscillospiraceae bacterium]